MKKREPVSHIMTQNVVTVDLSNDKLVDAKKLMEENNIRHIPVTSGNKLKGILSLTDINRISYGANWGQEKSVDYATMESLSIEQVMHHDPQSIAGDTSIKEVAEIFSEVEFHALPIVNQDSSLEGIVTTTDLIKYLLTQY